MRSIAPVLELILNPAGVAAKVPPVLPVMVGVNEVTEDSEMALQIEFVV